MFRLITALVLALSSFGLLGTSADAATTVSKSQRECLVFIANLSQGNQAQQAFYDFVEFAAESMATTTLGPQYNQVHVVKGSAATRAALKNKLNEIASKSTVKAVDLIFVTHGLSGSVKFSDQTVSMSTVRDDIKNKLSSSKRAKLRMCFSTACFGESHNSKWKSAGFKVVSGSKGIYADSAVSYLPFLASWSAGVPFQYAIIAANAADTANAVDLAAMAVLFAAGLSNWYAVDSTRVISGNFALTIGLMP